VKAGWGPLRFPLPSLTWSLCKGQVLLGPSFHLLSHFISTRWKSLTAGTSPLMERNRLVRGEALWGEGAALQLGSRQGGRGGSSRAHGHGYSQVLYHPALSRGATFALGVQKQHRGACSRGALQRGLPGSTQEFAGIWRRTLGSFQCGKTVSHRAGIQLCLLIYLLILKAFLLAYISGGFIVTFLSMFTLCIGQMTLSISPCQLPPCPT
jgi:hypothetical protein